MCVAFLALSVHSDYPFILALNRDEFFERPTIPVHIRREDPRIIAGKDLEGNGTWLGITTEGRFGIVTNVRDLGQSRNGTFSRGQLVEAFLKSDVTASDYIQSVRGASDKYNPFNMLVGTLQEVIYFTNRTGVTQVLSAGLHGLSNGLLNEAWPKVLRGKTLIKPILETSSLPSKKLLELLKDKWQPGDGELP
ncbi:MAG: NRDE family protein, partial [Deltaproteobacteria bacterium]|nr:NRDE family protein [Deltaproteobacteria bacterium]